MKRMSLLAALIVASSISVGRAQQPAARAEEPPPTPAPAPGSAGIYKPSEQIAAELMKAMANMTGDTGSSRVANTDQYRVGVVHRDKAGAAISHRGWSELHYVLEGSGVLVTGGTIVRPTAAGDTRTTSVNGEAHRMQKGDVAIIPAGSSHWYKEVNGGITYLEVRFIAPPGK